MDSFALIIFGITSNLAQIKLIPALYDMAEKGLLPPGMTIIGTARKEMSSEEFKEYFKKVLNQKFGANPPLSCLKIQRYNNSRNDQLIKIRK